MIAGVILRENQDEECQIAFLGDGLECFDLVENSEIVEEIEKRDISVLAVNAGSVQGRQEFTEKEDELREEGHIFTPSSHEKTKSKRLEALKTQLHNAMGEMEMPTVVRFDPHITAERLALKSDDALRGLGIDPESIKTASQFDATLGAVTARFYEQNQYENLGVIVPEPVSGQS
jgi:hypothetical protein